VKIRALKKTKQGREGSPGFFPGHDEIWSKPSGLSGGEESRYKKDEARGKVLADE